MGISVKLAIAVIGGMVLAGCQGLVSAQSGCNAQHSRYQPMWDCVKAKVAANQAGDMNNDLGLKYMAFGEALAERVRSGQVSDADAKYALANELSAANSEYERRKSRDMAALAAVSQAFEPQRPRNVSCSRSRVTGNVDCTSW